MRKKTLLSQYWQGLKLTFKIDKRLIIMQIFNAVGNLLLKYIGTLIMAIIINSLIAEKPKSYLFILAFSTVIIQFLIQTVTLYTSNRRYIRKSMWPWFLSSFFNKRAKDMPYYLLETSKTKEHRLRIERQLYSSKGIASIPFELSGVVSGLLGIMTSTIVLAIMFKAKSPIASDTVLRVASLRISFFALLLVMIISFFITMIMTRKTEEISLIINSNWARFSKKWWRIEEFFTDSKLSMDLKIYRMDSIINSEYDKLVNYDLAEIKKYRSKQLLINGVESINITLVTLLIFVFVVLRTYSGAFELGMVLFFVSNCTQFRNSISEIGRFLGSIKGQKEAFNDQLDYLDNYNENTENGSAKVSSSYDVEFKNVSFRYPDSNSFALQNVSFKINNGDNQAIVGTNGSGKTTIIKLLCGLYKPTEGEILINGINIEKMCKKDLFTIFSIVFQDYKIFSFPIFENIAIGKKYNDSLLDFAIKESDLYNRIESLEHGISTCVGKNFDANGVDFSGGELQKIALARSLYRQSQIYVWDEPTAQLDPISEMNIYNHYRKLFNKHTSIFISHRLSSCKLCNNIIVLQNGRIVQSGTHNQLISQVDGLYCELWHAQSKNYT